MALTNPDYAELTAATADYVGEDLVTGIIRNVGIGKRDTDRPVLWFDVYISESSAALTVIDWATAHDIVGRVGEVRNLNGMPCWCDVSKPGIIRFVRLWDAIR